MSRVLPGSIPAWNQNHTLNTTIHDLAVWYYQNLDREARHQMVHGLEGKGAEVELVQSHHKTGIVSSHQRTGIVSSHQKMGIISSHQKTGIVS